MSWTKIAIITGAASGIGRAAAAKFVAEGARVVIVDINCEKGEALATELGPSAAFKTRNVADRNQVQAMVDFAVHTYGGLNVMWNHTGISSRPHRRFIDDELTDFSDIMSVNVLGVMLGSQIAARYMKDQCGGSIINTVSMGGILAGYGVIPYRAAKAAVTHFSKCIVIAFGEHNIRVNCIHPSQIQTEMSIFAEPGMDDATKARINRALSPLATASQPLKRRGQPEDIANAGVYLASDRSIQMTGTEMTVDGGHSVGDPVNHLEEIMATLARVLEEG